MEDALLSGLQAALAVVDAGAEARGLQRLVERQRTLLEQRGQRVTLEMRHHEVVCAVDAADIVDAADVRMVERCDCPSLALEA